MKNNFNNFFKHPALLTVVLSLLLNACGQESGPSNNSAISNVSLDPVSFAEWDEQRGKYQGNIIVADLWATWCKPCIDRFPKMVELHHKYSDNKVTFVSINFDDPEDSESMTKAVDFLQEVNAEFDNFYFSENLIDAFAHMEVIALPVVVIYGKNGEEALRLTNTNPNNQFTEADIEAAIDKLLAAN